MDATVEASATLTEMATPTPVAPAMTPLASASVSADPDETASAVTDPPATATGPAPPIAARVDCVRSEKASAPATPSVPPGAEAKPPGCVAVAVFALGEAPLAVDPPGLAVARVVSVWVESARTPTVDALTAPVVSRSAAVVVVAFVSATPAPAVATLPSAIVVTVVTVRARSAAAPPAVRVDAPDTAVRADVEAALRARAASTAASDPVPVDVVVSVVVAAEVSATAPVACSAEVPSTTTVASDAALPSATPRVAPVSTVLVAVAVAVMFAARTVALDTRTSADAGVLSVRVATAVKVTSPEPASSRAPEARRMRVAWNVNVTPR